MKVIPVMCCTKLDIYVFIDFPVFIPWTHQIKVIPGMCRAKLDIYVFIDQ
jgi:coenzyme F420-reducing hydrogenase delta subunit